MTLYLDFDGTLIDVSERYYRIYREMALLLGNNPLEKAEYWKLRRQGISEFEILSQLGPIEESSALLALRANKLETARYLRYDKLIPGVLEAIRFLKSRAQLVLVTLRNDAMELRRQLQTLGLFSSFDQILDHNQHIDDRAMCKESLISENPKFKIEGSVIVGDSEADILAGKRLDIKSIAVLSGIRNREVLVKYNPDYIIHSVSALPPLFNKLIR